MTFGLDASNLKANVSLPYTATFSPGATTEAFTLTPTLTGTEWEYSYTNYFKLGSNCARHNDSYVYQLPYAPGSKYRVDPGLQWQFRATKVRTGTRLIGKCRKERRCARLAEASS